MRLRIGGLICDNDTADLYRYFGYNDVCCPADVRKALDDLPEGEELTLEINSGGGYVSAGFEVYSLLRGAKCPTVAEVQSFAASAASTIAVGCRTVLMSPVGQIMIHDPAICTCGNERDHRESVQMLHSMKESILNGYEAKCGGKCSREKLCELMDSETWLDARNAVELGLADGLIDYGEDAALVMNAAAAGMQGAAGMCALPSVAELRERKRAEDAGREDPKEEAETPETNSEPAAGAAENNDQWKRQARLRLELEKVRF